MNACRGGVGGRIDVDGRFHYENVFQVRDAFVF